MKYKFKGCFITRFKAFYDVFVNQFPNVRKISSAKLETLLYDKPNLFYPYGIK